MAEPAIGRTVAARWDHLLVDEFQDLNAPQYRIVQHLVEPHGSVFAVGDVRSGSVKRVASAVGEGAVVIRQVHDFLEAAGRR